MNTRQECVWKKNFQRYSVSALSFYFFLLLSRFGGSREQKNKTEMSRIEILLPAIRRRNLMELFVFHFYYDKKYEMNFVVFEMY